MSPVSESIIRHFISGDALFSGIALLVLAVAWRQFKLPGGEKLVWLLACAGAAFVFFSATPQANGGYLINVIVTVGWLLLGQPLPTHPQEPTLKRPRRSFEGMLCVIVAVLWLFEGVTEYTWRSYPKLPAESVNAPIVVLGDSISAGVGEDEAITWPHLLKESRGWNVIDLSQMGETVGGALKKLTAPMEDHIPEGAVVLIELGGNDVLGKTSVSDFERDLNELLKQVTEKASQTVMFELPLPPFCNRYGEIQRKLAKEYKVSLIPKRELAHLICSKEYTLDSIHLTQAGQKRMASVVEKLFPAE
ncbi:SGNH/GDSL hydrolase family protein [Planctomicrobium sp. SH527]|uniref:SGNH/GDSL hydrolase family protein n=1 Tax=Planctomicrobium sp. SH527 TaxID=3448123 RepID=UPI003F5CB6A4